MPRAYLCTLPNKGKTFQYEYTKTKDMTYISLFVTKDFLRAYLNDSIDIGTA